MHFLLPYLISFTDSRLRFLLFSKNILLRIAHWLYFICLRKIGYLSIVSSAKTFLSFHSFHFSQFQTSFSFWFCMRRCINVNWWWILISKNAINNIKVLVILVKLLFVFRYKVIREQIKVFLIVSKNTLILRLIYFWKSIHITLKYLILGVSVHVRNSSKFLNLHFFVLYQLIQILHVSLVLATSVIST